MAPLSPLLIAVAVASASAYWPGIPPQCFEPHQCVFYRTFNSVLTSWDLNSLCAGADSEYRSINSGNPQGVNYPQIRFNVCGTVAKPIAPLDDTLAKMRLPLPHSHGAAIQVSGDPQRFTCTTHLVFP